MELLLKTSQSPENQRPTAGFTLIELSISLLVIALIIGSVLVGVDLIHTARLQRILTQLDSYNKAVGTFRDKYHELPGDLSNAITFWGADTACPNTAYTASPHAATCNGDGNGQVGNLYVDGGITNYEIYRFWQQLADASLVEGAYNGIAGAGSSIQSLPPINVPAGPLDNTGFTLLYIFRPAGDINYWASTYGHSFLFGEPGGSGMTTSAALSPREAFILDTKIDDGRPAYGTVLAFKSPISPNCTTSDTNTLSTYKFTYTTKACSLIFITGY